MVEDLARWLGVQLDEDERIARAVEDRSAPWDGQWMADGNSAVRTFNGHVLFYRHGPDPLKPGLADYVAEWDPARVLREIDAKRRLASAHARDHECIELSGSGESSVVDGKPWELWEPRPTADYGPCFVLRVLALPYADRPGYREEWAP